VNQSIRSRSAILSLIAAFAVIGQIMLPMMAAGAASAGDWIEICNPDGVRLMPIGDPAGDQAPTHCPACPVSPQLFALDTPGNTTVEAQFDGIPDRARHRPLGRRSDTVPVAPTAQSLAQPRGPPAVS